MSAREFVQRKGLQSYAKKNKPANFFGEKVILFCRLKNNCAITS